MHALIAKRVSLGKLCIFINKISCIPFLIWFVSSIAWLAGDTGYQDLSYSNIYGDKGMCSEDASTPQCMFVNGYH